MINESEVKGDVLWWAEDWHRWDEGHWVYPLVVPRCAPGEPPAREMREMADWYRAVQLSQAGMMFWLKPDKRVYWCAHDSGGDK